MRIASSPLLFLLALGVASCSKEPSTLPLVVKVDGMQKGEGGKT